MLVTQAMKTVYSNIRLDGDYYLPNGKKLSGRELRDYAMRAIDNLSDRGLNRLLKDLHAVKKMKMVRLPSKTYKVSQIRL